MQLASRKQAASLLAALLFSVWLSGCALTSTPEPLGIRVTSQLSLADDPALRRGLAQAGVQAQANSEAQLTLRKVESLTFGNRLTITVIWAHRPAGQFALRSSKSVLSGELPAQGFGGYQSDSQVQQLRQQLLEQLGRQIGEEIQAYEHHQA